VALRRLCEFQRKPTTQGERLIAGGKIVRDFFQVPSTLVTKWVNLVVESVAASVVGTLLKALDLCHFVDLPDVVIYEFAIVCPFDAVVADLPIACLYRHCRINNDRMTNSTKTFSILCDTIVFRLMCNAKLQQHMKK
jgi:hypothetical protein